MSLDYHNLLKAAEEFKSEVITEEVSSQQQSIDRGRWISQNETQELVHHLETKFDTILDYLMNRYVELGEVECKCNLAILVNIRAMLTTIKDNK